MTFRCMSLTLALPDHLVRRIVARHPGVEPIDFALAAVTKAVFEPTPSSLAIAAAHAEADPLDALDDELWASCSGDGLHEDDVDQAA